MSRELGSALELFAAGKPGRAHGLGSAAARFLALVLVASPGTQDVAAQIADQVVLVGSKEFSTPTFVARFDRKLHLLGKSNPSDPAKAIFEQYWDMAVDGQGHYWFPAIHQYDKRGLIVRFDANGQEITPGIVMQHQPVFVASTSSGATLATSLETSVTGHGPLYGFADDGSLLWTNPRFVPTYHLVDFVAARSSGEAWVGGAAIFHWPTTSFPFVGQVDPATGLLVQGDSFDIFSGASSYIQSLAGAPDGTLWAYGNSALIQFDGPSFVKFGVVKQNYGAPLRVDAAGDILLRHGNSPSDPLKINSMIARYDSKSLALTKIYPLKGSISGFALGPSGEDVYAAILLIEPPYDQFRLVRLNLVTGTRSSVDLMSMGGWFGVPNGDPTGFIWANVTDQQGDADADGASNRLETSVGSDPFDATSRPEGPKIYITFEDQTNALVLTLKDPDGLHDPAGGLDFSSISLTAGGYGEVLPYLMSAITTIDVAADGKSETVTFGGRPLAEGLKIELEARVMDKTGATAWDWQVTPPGDL